VTQSVKYEEEKRRYLSFCGSYCHTCDWHTGKVRKTAQAALDMIQDYGGFSKLFQRESVDGDNFARGLEVLAESGICSGCKAEVPDYSKVEKDRCDIRQCCFENGYSLCSECESFPCLKLKSNPGVIKWKTVENLEAIDKIGLKQWIDNHWKDYTSNT
jgi:hypothetical protein